MASNFVPMLSSSPPPLEDCPDDEDEDEFGTFASANIAFDSSFDSPIANSKHKPYASIDKSVNDGRINKNFNNCSSISESKTCLQNHINDSPTVDINDVFQNEQEEVKENYFENSLNNYAKFAGCSTLDSVPHDKNTFLDSFSSSADSLDEVEPTICSFIKDSKSKSDLSSSKENLDCVVSDSSKPIPSENNHFYSDFDDESVDVTPCGLFKSDFIECNTQSQNINSCFDINSTKVNVCDSLSSEFPVNFETSIDDFHDFKQATPVLSQLDGAESEHVSKHIFNQIKPEQQFDISFSNSKQSSHEDSDEFDDFQSFDKIENNFVTKNISNDFEADHLKSESQDSDHVAESEDYDEFQWCSSSAENFANFDTGSLKDKQSSDSSEFANFESASFTSISDETSTCVSTQDKNADKITTVLNAIFPLVSETYDDYCDQPLEILEQSNKSHRLWEKLHEVEQAPGLRFQWGVSHSFQQLLRSVNVDYHSILRTSSFPIFASSLSLLEPVKGQINTVNAESEDRNQYPRVNDPIPPVEFDWTSSGLVNPLDSGQTASVLMDLSFLASADTATSNSKNDYSFENEFLKPSPIPVSCDHENRTLILEELLSRNVCSFPNSTTAHRPTNLSEEAKSVLDQLSDLSFMRATVLMFPISSKT